MAVRIHEVRSKRDRKRFIYFAEKLYENDYPQWVHPIYKMHCSFFDPDKNEAFSHSDAALFLALREDRVVGRIMGIINHKSNKFHNTREGRFSHFDAVNDQEVATALLTTVENWVTERGCDYIIGPLGFTNTDSEGLLIEGYEQRASIGNWWHPPYTKHLVDGAGYVKEIDWVSYIVDITNPTPERFRRVIKRVMDRSSYKLIEFTDRKQFKPWIEPVFRLMNETYTVIYGFSALSDAEISQMARDYMPFLDPRFGKVVILGDEVVGFTIGIPDFTAGIRAARGRLYPFGFTKVLRARKRATRVDMLLGAIHPEHRGRGIDMYMVMAGFESARKAGFTHVDSHQILESNHPMRSGTEQVGGKIYKRHRLYRKDLK